MRAFAEALEIIPYTLAENAGLHPIGIVTELRNAHAQGRRHDGALFVMLCAARERGCKRGLGQCAVCVLQRRRHGGAFQGGRKLRCRACGYVAAGAWLGAVAAIQCNGRGSLRCGCVVPPVCMHASPPCDVNSGRVGRPFHLMLPQASMCARARSQTWWRSR